VTHCQKLLNFAEENMLLSCESIREDGALSKAVKMTT